MPTETKTTAMPLVPSTLTVVLADTQASSCADMNENEQQPYRRRTVQIKLTEEQRQALTPRYTGHSSGKPTHEEILQAWLEPAEDPPGHRP
jgi:hypothetical protein